MPLTITEALADIKTVGKRIEKKQQFVSTYLIRQERFKDPLEKDGGSVSALKREWQAIQDLETRVVTLRAAIQERNRDTTITINGVTRSIMDWLTWRREIAPKRKAFLEGVRNALNNMRKEAAQKQVPVIQAGATPATEADVIVNINETELAAESEAMEAVLGDLDGQLSLKNATTFVTV